MPSVTECSAYVIRYMVLKNIGDSYWWVEVMVVVLEINVNIKSKVKVMIVITEVIIKIMS